MAGNIDKLRQQVQELSIEINNFGQSFAILQKTINRDFKDVTQVLDDLELEKKKLEVEIANLKEENDKKGKKKEPDFTDAKFKGEKE